MLKLGDFIFAGRWALVDKVSRAVLDRSGATVIDYGLLAGLVGLAAFVAFVMMGTAVAGMFDAISIVFADSLSASP